MALISIHVLLPLSVLCLLQYEFLPYHDPLLTFWHQLFVGLDLLVIWYFLVVLPPRRPTRTLRTVVAITVAVLGTGVVLVFAFLMAVVPGTWLDGFSLAKLLKRNLELNGELLISEPPPPELLAASVSLGESWEETYLRHAVGARLSGRDLRFAELEGAKLFNADLRGADLTGAWLVDADLRGANLAPPQVRSTDLQQSRGFAKSQALAGYAKSEALDRTRLDRVRLWGAKLDKSTLVFVSLVDAHLQGVDLAGFELTGADLRMTRLQGAGLAWAELSHANLEGAKLSGSSLVGATLDHASLAGASLRGANALAATFSGTGLEGTNLTEAVLAVADFHGAIFFGSDLRRSVLQGGTGLRLSAVDLRGAQLGGACEVDLLSLADLRSIDFSFLSFEKGTDLKTQLADSIPERLRDEEDGAPDDLLKEMINTAFDRIDATVGADTADEQAVCLGTPLILPANIKKRRLLYFDRHRTGVMANWPPVAEQGEQGWSEKTYQRQLAKELIDRVCSHPGLAQTVVARAAGEYFPGDLDFDSELAVQLLARLESQEACAAVDDFLESVKEEAGVDLVARISWRLRRFERVFSEP